MARQTTSEPERIDRVIRKLQATYPTAKTELHYTTPFELLVAVMLSAQTTDKRVNMVTPALFARYPDAAALMRATPEELLALMGSVNFAPTKARHLAAMAGILHAEHGGQVPDTMEELVKLPGVGRKTANVILSIIFEVAAIAVDTHVFRVSHRLGLSQGKTPEAVERDLMAVLPADLWGQAHHWLILHGRYTCVARRPHCEQCPVAADCPAFLRGDEPCGSVASPAPRRRRRTSVTA